MKIKKYSLHILILIALIGIFSPMVAVHGYNPYDPTHTNPNDPNFVYPPDSSNPPAPAGFGCKLGTDPQFQHLLGYATCIINISVIPLIFALAVALFVWGVVQFVINSGEEAKKEKGRQFMIWGIIALAVMVSVWGLVNILGNTFGIEYAIPQVKAP